MSDKQKDKIYWALFDLQLIMNQAQSGIMH